MKKNHILTIMAVFLLVLPIGQAYAKPEIYKGVQVRNYNTNCSYLLDVIPENYFEGLNAISFFSTNPYGIGGYYYPSRVISIFGGCDLDILVHELAHHYQIMKGDRWFQAMKHSGNFDKCEEEIWIAIEQKNK